MEISTKQILVQRFAAMERTMVVMNVMTGMHSTMMGALISALLKEDTNALGEIHRRLTLVLKYAGMEFRLSVRNVMMAI